MEDEKLAAYYDDLNRRGGGAARFKQGLGFSSGDSPANDVVPSRGSGLPTASSFLSGFVRASSPSKTSEFEKQAELQSIQNKLSKNPKVKARSRSPIRSSNRGSRSRSLSRDRIRDNHSRRRSRSRSRERNPRRRSRSRDRYSRRRSRSRERRSRRRSRSREEEERRKYRSSSRSRERSKRQGSPEVRKRVEVKGGGSIDYSKLIEGYDSMTPSERVKAKMKLQLSKTVEKDETIGKGSGWERFDFDKDAPLDDEEIEAAEDDVALVKHMGQSFRFSALEARREEKLKAAHDEAMFGGSSHPLPAETMFGGSSHPLPAETHEEAQDRNLGKEKVESAPAKSLLSDQVLTMQRGSWRDRVRKS